MADEKKVYQHGRFQNVKTILTKEIAIINNSQL